MFISDVIIGWVSPTDIDSLIVSLNAWLLLVFVFSPFSNKDNVPWLMPVISDNVFRVNFLFFFLTP